MNAVGWPIKRHSHGFLGPWGRWWNSIRGKKEATSSIPDREL